jgi:hypothetical protein
MDFQASHDLGFIAVIEGARDFAEKDRRLTPGFAGLPGGSGQNRCRQNLAFSMCFQACLEQRSSSPDPGAAV